MIATPAAPDRAVSAYRGDTIPVFAGPSLAGWVAAPPFSRHAPAAAGDMLRLLDGPPCTVVLIDGVFDSQRSVWHKEILLLMARGFRVVGAASMGALRAAELAPFGMIGHGAIFRAYASDRITADDEVAVSHAPPAVGGAALSVAQVDVRAAIVAAGMSRAATSTPDRLRRLGAGSAAGSVPMVSTGSASQVATSVTTTIAMIDPGTHGRTSGATTMMTATPATSGSGTRAAAQSVAMMV